MRDPETFQPLKRKQHAFSKTANDQYLRIDRAIQAGRDAGCYKKAYATKAAAELDMGRINARIGGRPKQLRHSYRCPSCGQFHNTSQRPHS